MMRPGKYFKPLDVLLSAKGSKAQWPRMCTPELDSCLGSNPSLPGTWCGSLCGLLIIVVKKGLMLTRTFRATVKKQVSERCQMFRRGPGMW